MSAMAVVDEDCEVEGAGGKGEAGEEAGCETHCSGEPWRRESLDSIRGRATWRNALIVCHWVTLTWVSDLMKSKGMEAVFVPVKRARAEAALAATVGLILVLQISNQKSVRCAGTVGVPSRTGDHGNTIKRAIRPDDAHQRPPSPRLRHPDQWALLLHGRLNPQMLLRRTP